MKESKKEKIKFIFALPCENTHTETIKGLTANASYIFRLYSGPTKVMAIQKYARELVDLKGFGLYVTRLLEFNEDITPEVEQVIQAKGYKIIDGRRMATQNKDFGYLSAQNYDVNYLIQKLAHSDLLSDWNKVCQYIAEEIERWGVPVVDVNGKYVYSNTGQVKRDPFANAANLALKRLISARREAQKAVKKALGNIGPNQNQEVDR